jgi:hypothetical protein
LGFAPASDIGGFSPEKTRTGRTVMKPTLFIGSSNESLDIAYAIQENLDDCSEPIVWKQGLFDVSEFVLVSPLDALTTLISACSYLQQTI